MLRPRLRFRLDLCRHRGIRWHSASSTDEDLLGKLEAPKKTGSSGSSTGLRLGKVLASLKSSSGSRTPSQASPSPGTSVFQQLLQNLEKDSGRSSTPSTLPRKRPAVPENSRSSRLDSRQTPAQSTASVRPALGLGSASVRDSFRRAENQRNQPDSTGSRPPYQSAPQQPLPVMSAKNASNVGRSILNSLADTLPSQAGASLEIDAPEITTGELRYQQHQERLKHQREKFSKSLPVQPVAPYRRPATAATSTSSSSSNSSIRTPSSNINSTSASARQQSGTLASSSHAPHFSYPRTTNEGASGSHGGGTNDVNVVDIAELKRRMAEKLSQDKEASRFHQTRHQKPDERQQRLRNFSQPDVKVAKQKGTVVKEVIIPARGLTLRDLSSKLSVRVAELTSMLEKLGEESFKDAEDHRLIEADVCELVVLEIGLDVKREDDKAEDHAQLGPSLAAAASVGTDAEVVMLGRAPVVCIMGHVDHGKTTLLDSLRKANVAGGEAGGITQKLSAFRVEVGGRPVVFLDTPGHAAFSKMRSHGAEATDLVVLVVALDDGVRPQTKEALLVAKEANCTILVALNKVDKIADLTERKAARARVLSQLVEFDLLVEDFGGDVMVVEVAGKTGEGLEQLVESILLQADVLELKAATQGQAEATVLDAYMEKGRGVVADVLVRWGTLSVGDPIVVDTMYGRVKAMVDDLGNSIISAGPSSPVRLLGLRTVPTAGQELLSVSTEAKARQISERRTRLQELKQGRQQEYEQQRSAAAAAAAAATATAVATAANAAAVTELEGAGHAALPTAPKIPHISVLLKADGVGTLEALEQIVNGLGRRTKDVTITISDASVGDVCRSDIERAFNVGNALILAFNVGLADSATRASAKELDVAIIRDTVIYRLEDSLKDAMQAQMPKERSLVREGTAKVQKVFTLRDKTSTAVAGLIVQSGILRTGSSNVNIVYKVTRADGTIIVEETDGNSALLKRFKDTVHRVEQGNECGLQLGKFKDWSEDDVVDCFRVEYVTRSMDIEKGSSGSLTK